MNEKELIKSLKLRFMNIADAMDNTGAKTNSITLTKEEIDAIFYCLYEECSYYEES